MSIPVRQFPIRKPRANERSLWCAGSVISLQSIPFDAAKRAFDESYLEREISDTRSMRRPASLRLPGHTLSASSRQGY